MNSVKILHCADIHIGAAESFLGARSVSRQAEAVITFEKIINTAKENRVDILLIAGDLFNSNNIKSSVVDEIFNRFASIPDIKIVFAAGNHDPLNADSPFKSRKLDNLFVLDTKDCFVEFSELNTRVYGKSFKEIYVKGEAEFSLKPDNGFINIMCLHGELRADLGSDYNSITNGFISNSGMDYIALGHVHKRTEPQKLGNTYYAYCGCPEGQGFDELGEKGVYLGEVSKGACNLQFIPTAKRMHLCENIDVCKMSSSSEIAEHIIESVKQKYGDSYAENLYKIVLVGGIDEGVSISTSEIAARLNDAVYFAKVKDKTEVSVDFELLSQEQSLKGIFVKKMLYRIENADENEKEGLKNALNIGLKAFSAEVTYDED